MTDEEIIRAEAKLFYEHQLNGSSNKAIDAFHEIKSRLLDFYSPEYKAIFLDELKIEIAESLVRHRIESHGGKASPECHYEIQAERLAFYIKQELSTFPTIVHAISKDNPKFKRSKVFVSYSHTDKSFLEEIKRHFKPFQKYIDFWDDTKILPGQNWKDEINKAINETKVAILLVSTDFLGSDFISNNELPPLLEAAEKDGASILMVILKPCLIDEFPELTKFQAMHQLDKPIVKMNEIERDELYVNLVRQTKRVLEL